MYESMKRFQRIGGSFTTQATWRPRKGVAVIMKAAKTIERAMETDDWHVLLCGNKGREGFPYEMILSRTAREHVTFGGYRSDTHVLHRDVMRRCSRRPVGIRSRDPGLEVQSSSFPLLMSNVCRRKGAGGRRYQWHCRQVRYDADALAERAWSTCWITRIGRLYWEAARARVVPTWAKQLLRCLNPAS